MKIKALKYLAAALAALMLALPLDAGAKKKSTARRSSSPAKKTAAVSQRTVGGAMAPHQPFVTVESHLPSAPQGLDNRIIAVWQSHGRFYNQEEQRWQWQRPCLFGTVEDLFTQGYVMPYLMPMLENAGAYVMSPRERDLSTMEIIIDTDGMEQSDFYLTEGKHKWRESDLGTGYAWPEGTISEFDNPFIDGTYETASTVGAYDFDGESTANWNARIPRRGRYAVYVSYKTLPNSATDALYTINHLGGATTVKVNQKMGSGTWIYLGHYDLGAGMTSRPIVTLTNRSADKGAVVSADAVKIGGGMGSVARMPEGELFNPANKATTSRYPRFTEGARYWLQWAGYPRDVYSITEGTNDYKDDYTSRARWVNYLIGGSVMMPDSAGLAIPVDLAFAFHTDAGTDSTGIVGTMGIYSTDGGHLLGNKRSRSECGDLTNKVINQVVGDIRYLHNPDWPLRKIRDARYYEVRQTKVPAMILELLSHQNFEDMKYGLDPQFRFDVSRAVYKGILKFLAARSGRKYTVTPLAPDRFAITGYGKGKYLLQWQPTPDPLEPTAVATYYVVEERVADGAFHPVATVEGGATSWAVTVPADGVMRSYRIVAGNDGGRSFPTSPLALCNIDNSEPQVLIVDGFTRVSAPGTFSAGSLAGFNFATDPGVADGCDIITTGYQYDFDVNSEYLTNEKPGFGATSNELETLVLAGNTRDYVAVHGAALRSAGYGFVSAQASAFAAGVGEASRPKVVDLLLGNQKYTPSPAGRGGKYAPFPAELRAALRHHLGSAGSLLVSGSYIGSDLFDNGFSCDHSADHDFASLLGYEWSRANAGGNGSVSSVASPALPPGISFSFNIDPLAESYAVAEADALRPALHATEALRYTSTGLTAAVAAEGRVTSVSKPYRVVAMGFPFETITEPSARTTLMRRLMQYLVK